MSEFSDLPHGFGCRPIDAWPGPRTRFPRTSNFRAGIAQTQKLLATELRQLRARNVVLQVDLRESQIRSDGFPRADAKPASHAIILSFDSKHGPLRYWCDKYNDWRDNLRAIALSLEALRAVDRYGVTNRGEQYTGWKALPPGVPAAQARMGVDDAVAFLRGASLIEIDPERRNDEALSSAYRRAAKVLHPDAGASPEQWKMLQEAVEVIREHWANIGA